MPIAKIPFLHAVIFTIYVTHPLWSHLYSDIWSLCELTLGSPYQKKMIFKTFQILIFLSCYSLLFYLSSFFSQFNLILHLLFLLLHLCSFLNSLVFLICQFLQPVGSLKITELIHLFLVLKLFLAFSLVFCLSLLTFLLHSSCQFLPSIFANLSLMTIVELFVFLLATRFQMMMKSLFVLVFSPHLESTHYFMNQFLKSLLIFFMKQGSSTYLTIYASFIVHS